MIVHALEHWYQITRCYILKRHNVSVLPEMAVDPVALRTGRMEVRSCTFFGRRECTACWRQEQAECCFLIEVPLSHEPQHSKSEFYSFSVLIAGLQSQVLRLAPSLRRILFDQHPHYARDPKHPDPPSA
jgi:hypothetical protein